jgi:hypothetical protein
MCLKIRYDLIGFPFRAHSRDPLVKLTGDRIKGISRKITASSSGTIDTPSNRAFTVDIRASKSCVKSYFRYL